MGIEELREEINNIDAEMAKLFVDRMNVVSRVAEYKGARGIDIEDRDREQRVIDSKGILIEDDDLRPYYTQFIKNTMEVSKRWQEHLLSGLRVAYCGDSYDCEAVKTHYPDGNLVEYASYQEAFNAVSEGECGIAVLPFETSYRGEVGKVLDLIFFGDLHVNGIFEHSDGKGLTRYAVLSPVEVETLSNNEVSSFLLMFTVKDEVGGLAKAINTISAYNFNMRIMRSRPMHDLPWHYYFYAEAEGNDTTENGRRMVNALKAVCPMVKVVGRFS